MTKLKTTLNNGDTIVYLEDVSNFNGSEETYKNGFIFWNYTDSTGYTYPPETYSRNVFRSVFNKEEIDKNSNSITLKEPWNKGTIESGTYVSQSSGGCTYNYSLINSKNLNTTDTKYNGVLKGEIDSGYCEIHKFKPATKYVKVLLWHNYSKNEVKTTYIKDLSFEQVY